MATATLESPLPRSLPTGSATVVFCYGTACAGPAPVKAFEFIVDGARQSAAAYRMPRFDMPCRRSGFWGSVAVRADRDGATIELEAELELADGSRRRCELGEIPVAEAEPPRSARGRSGEELIAICMGTFEPDPGMFAAQIDSLRSQTDTDWICVISDDYSSQERYRELCSIVGSDERFSISRAPERSGFYRNFERVLRMAPAEARLVALCDQDDVWYPDKLSTLRGSLGPAVLAYSDMRLVDETGRVLAESLWVGRSNNSTSMASMLIANTVTGASALFRREVLERALPFPDTPANEFHDHWIALVALGTGDLVYVDRPLYDYVQHSGAVLGGLSDQAPKTTARRRRLPRARARDWRAAYFLGYVPGEIRARTLLLRCADRLAPSRRRALERYLAAGSRPLALAWLALRPIRMLAGRTETLGGEWILARGIVWRWAAAITAARRWPERLALDTRLPDAAQLEHRRLRRWRARLLNDGLERRRE